MKQVSLPAKTALIALFALPSVYSTTAICYYPNGDTVTTYQPCNISTDGSPSACCELSSSACSLTGYCYGNAGVVYRGGCTDATFNAVQCPQQCRFTNSDLFSNINLCPGSNGNRFFTCSGSGEFTIDMCTTNFTFNAGTPFTPSSAVSSSQASTTTVTTTATPSSSTSTSSANSSPTPQTDCSDPALTVGLAVGIPLALLAAFLAAVIFWQHRKYTSTSRQPTAFVPPSQGYPSSPYTTATSGTVYGTDPNMSQQQQYGGYFKPATPPMPPAELQNSGRRYELQET